MTKRQSTFNINTVMKISKLIEKLQKSLEEHGDKDVYFQNLHDGGYEAVGEVIPEYPWKNGQIGVEDKEAGVDFIGLRN